MNTLKTIRKSKGFKQNDIAKKLKLDTGTYGKIERGEIKLTTQRLLLLAEILSVSSETLLHGKENVKLEMPQKANVTYIPVTAQAGLLTEVESPQEFEKFHMPMVSGDNLYMIKVEGDSMYPTLSRGDMVVIKQQESPFLNWGDIFVVDTLEGIAVKRLFQNENNNKYTLKSDNEHFPEYSIDKKDIRAIWHVKCIISQNLAPKHI
jgi:phage repressor protein C with HTH and peptisase S24 domain